MQIKNHANFYDNAKIMVNIIPELLLTSNLMVDYSEDATTAHSDLIEWDIFLDK